MYRDGLLDPLCGLIMGETAENLVDRYDISREEQDAFALESQQRRPTSAERRAAEMIPVEATAGRATVTVRPTSIRARTRRWRPSPSSRRCSARAAASRRAMQRPHRRRGRDGVDGRGPRDGGGPQPAGPHRRLELGGRAPRDHGDRSGARHAEGPRSHRPHDGRHRRDRDQRGLRRPGARLRA